MGREFDDDSAVPGVARPPGHDLPIAAVLVRDGEDPGMLVGGWFADPVAIPVHTGADGPPGGQSLTGYLVALRHTSHWPARLGLGKPVRAPNPLPPTRTAPTDTAAWPNGRHPFAPIGRKAKATP